MTPEQHHKRSVAVDAERHWWVTKLKALPTVSVKDIPAVSVPSYVKIADIEALITERTS